MENQKHVYNISDIFEEIPDDPENMKMNIPPEIAKEVGLEPGDTVKILVGDKGTLIIEKVTEESLKDTDGKK